MTPTEKIIEILESENKGIPVWRLGNLVGVGFNSAFESLLEAGKILMTVKRNQLIVTIVIPKK